MLDDNRKKNSFSAEELDDDDDLNTMETCKPVF